MSRRRTLGLLAVLYGVQGLPFGFQVTALPVYLREAGLSLTGIGLAGFLSLPWMLKVLWAPLVDRFGSERFGRRRSFIVPTQLGLALVSALAAAVSPNEGLTLLLVLVFLMNLFAATMDIAVDGLAVDRLRAEDLGYGNIAQVVGYKVGMLTGGGLLVWASGRIGWSGLFVSMALLVLLGAVVAYLGLEGEASRGHPNAARTPVSAPASLGVVVRDLLATFRVPGAIAVLVLILTYKSGEAMADAMWKPFLVDHGFTKEQIGLFVGTWGMGFSLAGSFLGGVAASRLGIVRAVTLALLFRVLGVAGQLWLALGTPTAEGVVLVTCVEHFFGGALTTAVFALMMSRVDRRIGGTHYTLLATVEVAGKSLTGALSGVLADSAGYVALFLVATLLCFVPLPFVRGPQVTKIVPGVSVPGVSSDESDEDRPRRFK